MTYVYQYSAEELAAAQEHAANSQRPRECATCRRQFGPFAQMVLTPDGAGRVCWCCHVLAGGHP